MTEMTKTADERPDAELAYRVLDQIDAHPELWDQSRWLFRPMGGGCGTAGCFAGWTCLLAGDEPAWDTVIPDRTDGVLAGGDPDRRVTVDRRATRLLRISNSDADELFWPDNDRDDLESVVGRVFGPRPAPVGQERFVTWPGPNGTSGQLPVGDLRALTGYLGALDLPERGE